MEEKIKITCSSKSEGSCEVLNKLKTEQKILELFETKKIEKIDIIYKNRELAVETSSN